MRTGDNAATYPPLMSVMGAPGADERLVNEVAGWLWRCASQSAGHMTDYQVDVGTAHMFGGARTEFLVRVATRARLMTKIKTDQGTAYLIVDDPEFLHIRLRKEIEWERQQRKDTRDPRIKAPVLRRDGDNCRWCGIGVMWRGQTSNRTGTLDHLTPGQAGTVSTMVVACKGCNGSRQDNPQWDDDHSLLEPPTAPNYGATTAAYLTQHGYPTEANYGAQRAPATVPGAGTAPTHGVRPATVPGAADDRTAATRVPRDWARDSEPPSVETRGPGSGRVGSGVSSPGTGGLRESSPRPRRRGRRGGSRTRPSPAQQSQPQGETR